MSFIYYLPLLFFKNILPINSNNTEYSLVKTSLSQTLYGEIAPIILQSIRIILAIVFLPSLNILNVSLFRKRYSNRIHGKFIKLIINILPDNLVINIYHFL